MLGAQGPSHHTPGLTGRRRGGDPSAAGSRDGSGSLRASTDFQFTAPTESVWRCARVSFPSGVLSALPLQPMAAMCNKGVPSPIKPGFTRGAEIVKDERCLPRWDGELIGLSSQVVAAVIHRLVQTLGLLLQEVSFGPGQARAVSEVFISALREGW